MPIQKNHSEKLFFSRIYHPENVGGIEAGHDIWSAHSFDSTMENQFVNFRWLNDIENNAVIGVHSSDDTLFLMGSYFNVRKAKRGIAYTYKEDSIWVTPKRLNIDQFYPKEGYYGFYMHPSGKVLLISMVQEKEEGFNEDLYVSVLNEEKNLFEAPIHLGETINTDSFEISPFISGDLQTLYFSSNKTGGYGKADIYKSTRLGSDWDQWSEPELLPPPINSDGFDAYFSVGSSGDAFFSSDRNEDNSDIYRVKNFYLTAEDSILLAQQLEEKLDSLRRAEEIAKQALAEANRKKLPITHEDSLQWIVDNIDSSSLVRIHYFYNKWKLYKQDHKNEIKGFIPRISTNDFVLVIGNADNIGSEGNNRIVAERRANQVKRELVDHGISENRIIVRNNGSEKPIATNENSKGRAENRRTDLYIIRWEN